jgi:hypothetical protein
VPARALPNNILNWCTLIFKVMAYPERKPIYEAYEKIIKEIVDSKPFKEYAEREIDSLDQQILAAFKEIRIKVLFGNKWQI